MRPLRSISPLAWALLFSGCQGRINAVPPDDTPKNILLIIADDVGLDASAQYAYSRDLPRTPTLDRLAENGIVFENAWATPACTTTRGTIITGQFGVHSGIRYVPASLRANAQTIQAHLRNHPVTENYVSAIVGKWHLGGETPPADHPARFGVEHYAGNLSGNLDSYTRWPLTINGETETSETYHTTKVTDLAIDWVGDQSQPWFLWLAYGAPHTPFHVPPQTLHSRDLSDEQSDIDADPRPYYLAAIEAMDHEIGRLLDALPTAVRENTLVVFLGDNGTPRAVIDTSVFPARHAKNTLYEGGIRVPMIVSGKGVTRKNLRESALVHTVDLFATIAQVAGDTAVSLQDSRSFFGLLSDGAATTRDFNYSEFNSPEVSGWAVRNAQHKLIQFENGRQELYDLSEGLRETDDLVASGLADGDVIENLVAFGEALRARGDIDITNAVLENRSGNCADYAARFRSTVEDVRRSTAFEGALDLTVTRDKCEFRTNAIPNHDFNNGDHDFAHPVQAQAKTYRITTTPTAAPQATPLTLTDDNAILLNGVKVDLLAAGCFGVGDGKIGCNDIQQPWRYDPMYTANNFRVDRHNAHTQPNGMYHYHGPPNALYAKQTATSAPISPVIGFAADGFPIFGPLIQEGGLVREARSSYVLRSGTRGGDGVDTPRGAFDGTFRDDYEFRPGEGDLDACNGMVVNRVYGYYITRAYPYVLGCFTGTPDPSFSKR